MNRLEEDVRVVVVEVWEAVSGLRLRPCGGVPVWGAGDRAARVRMTGKGEVCLLVRCDAGLAREAAVGMLGKGPASSRDSAVADAVRELANIVAGNIRTMFPGLTDCGLPESVSAAEMPEGERALSCVFENGNRRLEVSAFRI